MNELGKTLVAVGVVLVVVGIFIWSGAGPGRLGRLPGDIHYTRGGTHVYFPLATCLLLSVFLSLLLWLLRKL